MGTRNLTMVVHEGKTKVGQYGQWDGYPSGQGSTVLSFLKKTDLNHFKSQLKKCKFLTKYKQTEMKKFMKSIGAENGWMNGTQAEKYYVKYPYLSRDHAADILELIDESKDKTIWLNDSSSFAADSLFCEWAYVIDLDRNTLEVYEGFNHTPLKEGDRFFGLKTEKDSGYSPIKLIATFNIDSLPTEEDFIKILEPNEA